MKTRSISSTSRPDDLRFRLSIKALGAGVWDYDIVSDQLYCDERWHEILGLDPARHRISCLADFRPYIHPEDVAVATRVDPAEIEALSAGDTRYHVEFRVIRPDGAVRKLRSVACIVRDPVTGHHRAIGCVLDLTEAADDESVPQRARPAPRRSEAAPLSAMELECLTWVIVGKTAWETSIILGRSRKTVEFHLANATRKLGASNKVHAAALAIRQGLI